MVSDEQKRSPQIQKSPPSKTYSVENGESLNSIFSPGFKSVAAMAGWDEEALLVASLIVEDTPDRDFKHKKRSDLNFKTPPTNSRRKRRAQRSPKPIPVAVLDLDEEESPKKNSGKKNKDRKACANEESTVEGNNQQSCSAPSSSSALPCIDKLKEELSCAICLEICFEPSTTPCGHSFCRKCLRSAADKCGKRCPKCRQLISNGRSCTVNTVLWNTIQLLFPQEVEARKAAGALNSREAQCPVPETAFYSNLRNRSIESSGLSSRGTSSRRRGMPTQDEDAALARRLQRQTDEEQRQGTQVQINSRNQTSSSSGWVRTRRGITSQDEDAALALRLQREEFMQAFRGSQEESSRHVSLARENLRALASRAVNLRLRDRRT